MRDYYLTIALCLLSYRTDRLYTATQCKESLLLSTEQPLRMLAVLWFKITSQCLFVQSEQFLPKPPIPCTLVIDHFISSDEMYYTC